jgi:DNA-binding MarR family transcriptional regulator
VTVAMKGNEARDDELPSIPKIDKTIHEPARLMIMAYLFVVESADFLFLQRQTGLTWGNLSSHLSKLENAGYVAIEKEFLDKKPHTTLHLTDKGRTAFQEYRESMKQVFEDLPE